MEKLLVTGNTKVIFDSLEEIASFYNFNISNLIGRNYPFKFKGFKIEKIYYKITQLEYIKIITKENDV